MPPTQATIVERIAAFVEAPQPHRFEELALEAFAFQYDRSPPYRRLCAGRGVRPDTIRGWREIPAVPAAAYRTLELRTAPAREVFRSSGTTGGARSVHHHPFPELYARVIEATFPRFCLPHGGRLPVLSLIPPRRQLPDSSLGFMADRILRAFGSAHSAEAFGPAGVDGAVAGAWCAERRAAGRPAVVLATAFALVQWFEDDPAADLRLPAGSVVFETGGFKGRLREITRPQLTESIAGRLAVSASRVVREYGMTELTSQFYTRVLEGGDADVFVELPWLKARLLEPETLDEAEPGEAGIVTIFDLANVGSAVHLLTQDLGVAAGGGFRLLGRAGDAELRGCSLTVEELERYPRGGA